MQKAVLMMDYLNVTQKGNGDYSHKGDFAIDIAGKDSGIESLKAPFTGVISTSNSTWFITIPALMVPR